MCPVLVDLNLRVFPHISAGINSGALILMGKAAFLPTELLSQFFGKVSLVAGFSSSVPGQWDTIGQRPKPCVFSYCCVQSQGGCLGKL